MFNESLCLFFDVDFEKATHGLMMHTVPARQTVFQWSPVCFVTAITVFNMNGYCTRISLAIINVLSKSFYLVGSALLKLMLSPSVGSGW